MVNSVIGQSLFINYRIQTVSAVNDSLLKLELGHIDSIRISGFHNDIQFDFTQFGNLTYCEIFSDTVATIPDDLLKLPLLKRIYFYPSYPISRLPAELRSNTNLVEFGMSFESNDWNRDILESLTGIQVLALNGEFVHSLTKFPRLQSLDLAISKRDLDDFMSLSRMLPSVKVLTLRSSQEVNINNIQCDSLEYLYLFSKHRFDPKSPPKFMSGIKALRIAYISDRKYSNLEVLYSCPNLSILEIGYFKARKSVLDCTMVSNLKLIKLGNYDSRIRLHLTCPNLRIESNSYWKDRPGL